jgi:hypothetical protein
MLPNHIVIGISDDGQKLVVQPVHPFLPDALHDVPLAEMERLGHDGAVKMLGTGILMALCAIFADTDTLTPYPGLLPPPEDSPSLEQIALAEQLAYIALQKQDVGYLPVIDDLMKVEPGKRASNHPFMASWPGQRELLERVNARLGG